MTGKWTYVGEAYRLRAAAERVLAAWDNQARAGETIAAMEALREALDRQKTIHVIKGDR